MKSATKLVISILLGLGLSANVFAAPIEEYVKWTEEWPEPNINTVANIIYDTDMSIDCDDAGALAMLHAMEQKGKVNLLAMMASTSGVYVIPAIDVINTYYGRPDIPLGMLKTRTYVLPAPTNFNLPLTALYDVSNAEHVDGTYTRDAVEVYRETLAKQPDNSVTILVAGMQTNLDDLLKSEPDEYSELNGMELVRKKVKMAAIMAGVRIGYNFNAHPESAMYVLDHWPTPIVYTEGGVNLNSTLPPQAGGLRTVQTGGRRGEMAEDDPVRLAYDLFLGSPDRTRSSHDLITTLYAVIGCSDYWRLQRGDGKVELIDGSLRGTFTSNPKTGARANLIKNVPDKDYNIDEVMDEWMVSAKKGDNLREIETINSNSNKISKTGTWTVNNTQRRHDAFGGNLLQSSTPGDSISISFSGTMVDVYGSVGPEFGKADVYIDGVKVTTIDTYAKNRLLSKCIYHNRDLAPGEHTLELVVLSETNGSDTKVSVDFFKVQKPISVTD